MKLRLRIGRQREQAVETAEVRTGGDPAVHTREPRPAPAAAATASAPLPLPLPRMPDLRVVRAGSFCRVGEIGQTAVTEAGRAVRSIPSGRCGRWVYADRA